jgi:hypothetical protein
MRKIRIAAILLLGTALVVQLKDGYCQSRPQLKKMDNDKALI